MGSPGIGKLVRGKAPNAKKENSYSYYTGKRLVIDLMMWLYKFKIAMINDTTIRSINVCLWSKVSNMLRSGIIPIFVMDGKPPKMKRNTLDKRRKIKDSAKNKLKDISEDDSEEKIKLLKRSIRITDEDIEEAMSFLRSLGVPVIQAMEEADPQCAGINIAGKAYGVVSEDWDTLIFGADKMITNFSKRKKIVEYDRDLVLKSLDVTQDQLVELAIILGCDYCDQIMVHTSDKNKKAKEVDILFNKYKQYGNLENLLEGLHKENLQSRKTKIKYKIPSFLKENWRDIKSQFIEVKIYNPISKMSFKWNVPDYSSLKKCFNHMDSRNSSNHIRTIRKLYDYYSKYDCLINSCKRDYKIRANSDLIKNSIENKIIKAASG